MGRLTKTSADQREILEGHLAQLGCALVILRLIADRIAAVQRMIRVGTILAPALEDIERVSGLLRAVQCSLIDAQSSPALPESSEYSRSSTHIVHQNPVPAPPARSGCQKIPPGG